MVGGAGCVVSGIPLVLVPGMMCDERLFAPQVDALGPDRTIMIADCAQDDSISTMATRLLADAPERFCIGGLSMGGIVAFEVLRQVPERVAGLALLNTTPHADAPEKRPIRLAQCDRVRAGALREVVLEELKPNYLSPVNRPDQPLLDLIYDMAASLGPEVFERQNEALMQRRDSKPTLADIACPTLIVAGLDDTVCPPALHSLMHARIAGSTYVEVADCGHLSTLEAPSQVTQVLGELLQTIDDG